MFYLVRPRDRHEEIALIENPRQRELCDGTTLTVGNRLKLFEQFRIPLKIRFVKARAAPLRFFFAEI